MKAIYLLVFFVLVSTVSGDIIYFNNGDIDEGYAEVVGDRIIITKKDEVNKYEMSTNKIEAIEYGAWIDDKGQDIKAIAEDSKGYTAPGSKAINKISSTKVKGISLKSAFGSLGTARGISMIIFVIGTFACFIVAFVGNIIILVDAFKKSLAWGFLCIFVPLILFIYLLTNYTGNKGRMFFWVYLFPLIWVLAGILLMARL